MTTVDEARTFLADNHHAVLVTRRRDGRLQTSPVGVALDSDGDAVISSRETAMKTKNLIRDPHAVLCVLNDGFYGEWHQIEGTATILHLPDAMDGLVDYYRRAAGEHPDWDEYRAAMERDRRVLIKIRIDAAGPSVSG